MSIHKELYYDIEDDSWNTTRDQCKTFDIWVEIWREGNNNLLRNVLNKIYTSQIQIQIINQIKDENSKI